MFARAAKVLPPGLPPCLKKRRLLNEAELNPSLARDLGEKFLALGWWEDALEFFLKAGDQAGLARVKTHALETGDAYLLTRLGGADPEDWRRLGEQALALSKLQFARKAFEKAGDREKSEAVGRLLEERGPAAVIN